MIARRLNYKSKAEIIKRAKFGLLLAQLVLIGYARAQSLAPPPYEVYDRHGVNMASGQVTPTLTDVTIGDKSLGLAHTISTYSSNFVNWDGSGPLGFRDKYYGGALKVLHHKPAGSENVPSAWIYVLRVWDDEGAFDFNINSNGTYSSYNGDPRHNLVFSPGAGLSWTKPDGTADLFGAGMTAFNPDSSGLVPITSKVYPNGFTITVWGVGPSGGVSTNSGYQLKYIYVQDNSTVTNDDPTNTEIPPALAGTWGRTIPRYIVAINNAVDYCALNTIAYQTSVATACPGLTKVWPTATYAWPGGMPRAMYLADASFTVTDSLGRVTEYMHHPYAKPPALLDPQYRIPRIIGIKRWGEAAPAIGYDYVTLTHSSGDAYSLMPVIYGGPTAQLSSSTVSTNPADVIGYTIGQQYQNPGQLVNGSGGQRVINHVLSDVNFGIYEVDSWNQTVKFEQSIVNRLSSVYSKVGGVTTSVTYDARYNVNGMLKNGVIVQSAQYPSSCSNPKTCNQPIWVKDALGNQTDFEYDGSSGQVTRVRYPAALSGIRPEIRYSYTPKYAYYKGAGGVFQSAPSPVYVLTQERKCISSATAADGSGCIAGAADEVVTDYDYGSPSAPNNLQVRGLTVTAYVNASVQVLRTCYNYDAYGNRIGETTANALLGSCN